ncbi:geranylgeranyl pyrophosphate synthase-like [Pieris rapae]|uniref:geranylgeranyl pyrophosphate synthase-like n=1 Tax=Pieris rapae TaxID=64459 RepID=UPI001E280DAF|nr:geranylgeranyl pyrophosphate synthase-like [Pieris rapae]
MEKSKENDSGIYRKSYMEKELLAPYTHILKVVGKRLRNKIPIAFNTWFKLPQEKINKIMEVVDIVYNGTLLIDDIQDNTLVRRGIPSAHCVYGIPFTLNCSLQVLTIMLQKLLELHPMAAKLFSENFLEIVRGQGTELYWREHFICPTEEKYDEMNKQKTGHMFLISVRLMQLLSDSKNDYTDLVLTIGLYFQLRDDYCNLIQQEALEEWPSEAEKKNATNLDIYCEDLTEGKFTLPIIHAARTTDGDAILNILRQRTRDVALKKFCVAELQRLGSLKYTRDRLVHLDKHIRDEINRLGGNTELMAAMDELFTW